MAAAFPGTFIDLADAGRPVYLWGEPGTSGWVAGMLDHMAPAIAGDHGVDRATHTLQLAVTTASKVPPRFTSERHRRAFARFERAAPEWRAGRVPIVAQQVTFLNLAAVLVATATKLKPRVPRFPGGGPNPPGDATLPSRPAWFDGVERDTRRYDMRGLLPDNQVEGPAVIHDQTTCLVVPPGFRVRVDEYRTFWLERT